MFKSVTFKFGVFYAVFIVFTLVGFGIYNYLSNKSAMQKQLALQTESSLTRIQTSLPSTIWNYETERMEEVVRSELTVATTTGILVFDDNNLLIGLRKDANGELIRIERAPSWNNTREQTLIYNDGQDNEVGRVVLQIDSSSFDNIVNDSLITLFWQIVIMLVLLIVVSAYLMRKIVLGPIVNMRDALSDIASGDGDLTKRLAIKNDDEIADLSQKFNLFIDQIHAIVTQVIGAIDILHTSTSSIHSVTQKTNQQATSQQKEIETAVTSMNEMSATAADVATNAASAAMAANQANSDSQTATQVLTNTVVSLSALAEKIESSAQVVNEVDSNVQEITSVLAVIRGIAEQTNLLALNAAIESARAGEQGRGFAVVADEVRALAAKTQDCTEEIQGMITKLQDGTTHAVSAMNESQQQGTDTITLANQASESLAHIVQSISTINDMNTQIASAAEEQTAVTDVIQENLNYISVEASKTQEAATEGQDVSVRLGGAGQQIRELMSRFKV